METAASFEVRNAPSSYPTEAQGEIPWAYSASCPLASTSSPRQLYPYSDVVIVRYADDFVVGFEYEDDASRFWDALRSRLEEFALSLHPDKTRLIEFGRHAADRRARAGLGKPETFTFLGFLFVCGKSRRGQFLVHRKSRRDRMQAKLKEVKKELRKRMHQPIPEQGRWLAQVVRGYFAYHAVPTNRASISPFRRYNAGSRTPT
jgi:hypothetical protein